MCLGGFKANSHEVSTDLQQPTSPAEPYRHPSSSVSDLVPPRQAKHHRPAVRLVLLGRKGPTHRFERGFNAKLGAPELIVLACLWGVAAAKACRIRELNSRRNPHLTTPSWHLLLVPCRLVENHVVRNGSLRTPFHGLKQPDRLCS